MPVSVLLVTRQRPGAGARLCVEVLTRCTRKFRIYFEDKCRRGRTAADEPIEKQVTRNRIYRANPQCPVDKRSRGGSAAGADQKLALPRVFDSPEHDQESARETFSLNPIELTLGAAEVLRSLSRNVRRL